MFYYWLCLKLKGYVWFSFSFDLSEFIIFNQTFKKSLNQNLKQGPWQVLLEVCVKIKALDFIKDYNIIEIKTLGE